MEYPRLEVNQYYEFMSSGKFADENRWSMPEYNPGGSPSFGKFRRQTQKNPAGGWLAPQENTLKTAAQNHCFSVYLPTAGEMLGNFLKVSGLQKNIVLEHYREGGHNGGQHFFPSHYEYANIVLERTVKIADPMRIWMAELEMGMFIRHTAFIVLFHANKPQHFWIVEDALPVKIESGELDALSGEALVTRIELAHRGITLV